MQCTQFRWYLDGVLVGTESKTARRYRNHSPWWVSTSKLLCADVEASCREDAFACMVFNNFVRIYDVQGRLTICLLLKKEIFIENPFLIYGHNVLCFSTINVMKKVASCFESSVFQIFWRMPWTLETLKPT